MTPLYLGFLVKHGGAQRERRGPEAVKFCLFYAVLSRYYLVWGMCKFTGTMLRLYSSQFIIS